MGPKPAWIAVLIAVLSMDGPMEAPRRYDCQAQYRMIVPSRYLRGCINHITAKGAFTSPGHGRVAATPVGANLSETPRPQTRL